MSSAPMDARLKTTPKESPAPANRSAFPSVKLVEHEPAPPMGSGPFEKPAQPAPQPQRNGRPTAEVGAHEWFVQAPAPAADSARSEPVGATVPTRTAAIDRVEHLIASEVVSLRNSKAESLTVILKPDARTEMTLQIRQSAGQTEALVQCDPDVVRQFQSSWPQLQDSLAALNVRLLPLKEVPTPGQFTFDSTSQGQPGGSQPETSFSRHPQRQPERADAADQLPGATPPPKSEPPARPVRRLPVYGWETWA